MNRKRNTTRILIGLLTCITVWFGTMSTVSAASGDNGSNELTIGVPSDRCPIFYQDADTHEIVGIGIDLMRIAAEEAGYTVTFQFIEEETLKDALDNEAYDVILPFGSPVSSTSGKPSVVSDNLMQTPFTLVTINKRKLPPFNELRVGMLRSLSAGAETVQALYPGIEIFLYETMDDCVKALRNGEVDALLHNSYVWSYVLQKPSYSDLSVQPSAVFSMDFRAGTINTPSGQMIIDRLNSGIDALTDTERQAIVLDYTSRRLYQYDLFDYLYQYGVFLLLGILLLVSIILIIILKWRSLRLAHEEKMRQLIDHDPLTGVFSLNGFRKKVEEMLRTHPDVPYFLTYNNIRNFKYINDSLGMDAGDELLRFWANKSMENMTEEDVIGRVEADHFAVLRRISGDDQLALDEKNVLNPVRNFFIKHSDSIRVQICTGLYTLTPEDYQHINVDHMLDFARVAEKRARESHKDGFEIYNPDQWKLGKLISDVASSLPQAIDSGDIQVWYQPQIHYKTGEICGAEALCRWNHVKRGWISPSDFIPALEEAGLIYDLDSFVWDRVAKDLHRWNERGIHRSVSVNLSRSDITKNQNIPEHFRELISAYNLTPDQIHVEITETAYVENPEQLIDTTKKLREYGFQVEMDDFGSGYSSLNMLKEVQVDRIKLDLHFLTETGDPEKGRIIIHHIIQMAKSLGMSLIAEGVEHEEQACFLQNQGCSEMQGFYFYKPMPEKEFEKLQE